MTVTQAAAAGFADKDPRPPIGGFFERHEANDAQNGRSVLAAWTEGRPFAAYVNARSAFAALAARFPDAAVWLPAFLCRDMAQPAFAARTRIYGVREGFRPDLETVAAQAAPGDLVLAPAYFGQPLSGPARQALAQRPDLTVVEDRAQALDAGRGAAWRLFSPRKLLGVADGGLLVAPDAATPPPRPLASADAAALWAAPLMRAEDPAGRRNGLWHAANQAKEAAMGVTHQAMTQASLDILSAAPLDRLTAPRLANWCALDQRLQPWSAHPAEPCAPPLGYVLRLDPDRRDRVLHGLHAQRIFAAVHWPRILGRAESFPRETQWTRELITLPCDHRYNVGEMARVADAVLALLR